MAKDSDERKLSRSEFEEIVSDFEGAEESDLFIVWKKNPYVRQGKFVYLYNEGFQEVKLISEKRAPGTEAVKGSRGRLWRLRTTEGLFFPRTTLLPFVRRVPRRP